MEEIVGCEIVDKSRGPCAFVTWGRLPGYDLEDDLIDLIKGNASTFGICKIESIRITETLQDVSQYPYFFEAVFWFSKNSCSNSQLDVLKLQMAAGKELYFLGFMP